MVRGHLWNYVNYVVVRSLCCTVLGDFAPNSVQGHSPQRINVRKLTKKSLIVYEEEKSVVTASKPGTTRGGTNTSALLAADGFGEKRNKLTVFTVCIAKVRK